jgi:hypothetical protein
MSSNPAANMMASIFVVDASTWSKTKVNLNPWNVKI